MERDFDSPGRMLAGDRYQLGEKIGRGGMGDVLAARDVQIGRDVAIKRLRVVDDRTLERFMREACIQGQLDHPAIVPVHELGVDEHGVPFFVMKRVVETTLASRIATESRPTLLRAFIDVCLAIEFAHERGFIHRDLKPQNIVLGDYGEVYVLDWGVAKVHGHPLEVDPRLADPDPLTTRDGVIVGTPGYMAPEQVQADPGLDGRADVYALGCILFEILAGERLHPVGEPGLFTAVSGELDPRPSRRAPDRSIAPELDEICVRATAVSRSERFASARELGDHVQRYVDGDRDVVRRHELARGHLAEATASFAAGDDPETRRRAMRSAGRALALDPELVGAGELVGRLMLEPPARIPHDLAIAIDEHAAQTKLRAARVAMLAAGAYLLVLPPLFASGFSSVFYPIALIALIAANFGAMFYVRSSRTASIIPSVVAAALLVALIARMFSPFLVAPGIAATLGIMIVLVGPAMTRAAVIAAIATMFAAVIVPWILEAVGWLTPSFAITNTSMIVQAPALEHETHVSMVLFIAYTAALIIAAMSLAAGVKRAERAMRDQLQLQAWQLRQLVAP